MKAFLPVGWLPVILCLIPIVPLRADEDVMKSLETLREKVAQKEESKEKQEQYRGEMRLTTQIRRLQALIERGDYDEAQQILRGFDGYMPSDFIAEWQLLVDGLSKEIEKKKAAAMEKWRKEVDQLVIDARKACLEAKTAGDLDAILIRCAPLQMKREAQNNVLSERTYRKLTGTAEALEAWANYLDFCEVENAKAANDVLRNMLNNQNRYPLLAAKDIEARFVEAPRSSDPADVARKVYGGIKTLADMPKAIEQLQPYADRQMNGDMGVFRSEKTRLENFVKAEELARKGDDTGATRLMQRGGGGSWDFTQGTYDMLKAQIAEMILKGKMGKWTKLQQNEGEDVGAYVDRVLEEMNTKGDYASMIEVMKFADPITRSANSQDSIGNSSARGALQQFLTARRFEEIGDNLAAATNYRMVVAVAPGKWVPTTQAQEALKKLQEKDPAAFKSYEGVLLEEIRSLKQQMQMMMGRIGVSGRPGYPMYPGYPPNPNP